MRTPTKENESSQGNSANEDGKMGASDPKNFMPFAEWRKGVMREEMHAMYAVRAMLRAAEHATTTMTKEDFADTCDPLVDCPKEELLSLIKTNVGAAAAAAGLVFMHSAYENAVFDLIRRLVWHDPEGWSGKIAEMKISFGDVSQATIQELQTRLLDDWLKKVEKESFPTKVRILLAFLKPDSLKGIIRDFEFDEAAFCAIDKLRHSKTHRPNFVTPIDDINGKLRYLHCTVMMLEKLAEAKYPPGTPGSAS